MKSYSPGKSGRRSEGAAPARAQRRTLRLLVETQRALRAALLSLMDESIPPDVAPCIHELLYATTWCETAMDKHLSRGKDRGWEAAIARLGVSADRMAALPTVADRLRLVNRAQRWMVAQMAAALAEDLAPEVRTLLEEASAIYLRGGRRCDEIIATLDRQRELPSLPEA